jgi:hypothetical protein
MIFCIDQIHKNLYIFTIQVTFVRKPADKITEIDRLKSSGSYFFSLVSETFALNNFLRE